MSTTITYRPARARFEEFQPGFKEYKQTWYANHAPALQAMTKQQLMETGDVAIHESYTKPELIDDALRHRWARTEVAQEYERLMHLESRESEVIDNIESIQGRLDEAMRAVVRIAQGGKDVNGLEAATNLVKQIKVLADLWQQVADLIGPDGQEPLQAIRLVASYATDRVLDAVQDRAHDLFEARMQARWVNKNEHLIKALNSYKDPS